ncbi:hypothetical protein CIG75_04350 [Tumebacillus algifaecis]|uniref:Cytosolic protein n=2 Tax=Tumebacillus algifaecis TaxID=1214604 RepID=A0A223D6P3_9BACL|nr:hypothetical protein CIG75_04350 [Tumebacillus algifaecis]
MKFVNDLYSHYREQLVGDEEDAVVIVSGILEELKSDHLLDIIRQMNRQELYEMLGRYLVEQLREKMTKEGVGKHRGEITTSSGDIH